MQIVQLCAGSYLLKIDDIDVAWVFNPVPDVSKFLIQRDLPINGVVCSDSRLQQGVNCHLIEFPLLHALFNHGLMFQEKKPIVVGSTLQIKAAMEGFQRSLYGFASLDEMDDCGLDKTILANYKREIKGLSIHGLQPPENYLDSLKLVELEKNPDDASATTYRGLSIWKKDVNVFELSYNGERATIDCNIRDVHGYKPPLKIDVKNIPLTLFQVIDTGEEDGFSPKSCMHTVIQWRDKIICVDLPMNASYLLEKISVSRFEIDAVVFTHCHDDHIGDFSMLLQVGHKVQVICPPLIWKSILFKASTMLSIPVKELELYFDFIPMEFGKEINYGGLRIMAHPSIHPVPCAIYRFSAMVRGQWKTYAHLSDILNLKRSRSLVKSGVIDKKRYDAYRNFLLKPADIKKVDVGTVKGKEAVSVHGSWRDFKKDKSEHIVLGHIREELLEPEAKITVGQLAVAGSSRDLSSEFSLPYLDKYVERAIRQLGDYLFYLLEDELEAGETTRDHVRDSIRLLSNQEIILIQPNTPFLKIGEEATHVDLIVSGVGSIWQLADGGVERIASVQAGDVIGEMGVLEQEERNASILAETYMRVLRIPGRLFRDEMMSLGIYQRRKGRSYGTLPTIWNHRHVIQRYKILSDEVPLFIQNRLAQHMMRRRVSRGDIVCKSQTRSLVVACDHAALVLVDPQGREHAVKHNDAIFGEAGLLSLNALPFTIKAKKSTDVLELPAEKGQWIKEVPLFRLRLREHLERRVLNLKRSR